MEGNTVQLPAGFAVLRLQLLSGRMHRAAPALPVAEGLCQAGITSSALCQLLWGLCCTADPAGADGHLHPPLRSGPQEKCQCQTISKSLMAFPCLAWTSSYCFEQITRFSLEGLLIFFSSKVRFAHICSNTIGKNLCVKGMHHPTQPAQLW